MDRTHLQSEEDIYTAGDEMPQPSAPLDIAKFKIKVDWTEPFPERWRARLHKALQSWLSRLEGKPSVHSIKLMDDPSWAEVQITPSTARQALKKLRSIPLIFKHENKEVTAWICPDETQCVTASCKTSMSYKIGFPLPKVNSSIPVTSTESEEGEDAAAANSAPNQTETTKPALEITVPLYPYWYMHHAYRKELKQFEKQHGVCISAEVSVSIKHIQSSNPDSVSKTTEDFQKLVKGCVDTFSDAAINHNVDSDIVKEALNAVQSEKEKIMFTMSASDCLFFGPKKFTDTIKRETTRLEQKFKEKRLMNLFDDKMTRQEKLIGYSGEIPHARGFRWNQMPDYGPGAVGGAGRDEGVNFRVRGETDTGFNEQSKNDSKHDSKGAHAEEETCPICMDNFTDKIKLKCGHEFCQECIRMSVESLGSICPVCKEVFGKLEGNQPDGTMTVRKSRSSLPGYPHCDTIEITYNIPSGIQTNKHPNPGKPYHGAKCHAYLPDNDEGNEVLGLLQRAFKQKLIFTVGTSTISGLDNSVIWNDIHHKTNTLGGPLNYGYPDPDYLRKVKDELKAKGIKEETTRLESQFKDKLQKNVFDEKMKKLLGYSGNIPHSKGIRLNQTPDYGPGAVGGAGRDEGVNFRVRGETDTGFNEQSKNDSKHDSKGAHAEEETCPICMDNFTDKIKLKCGHEFCQECIRMSVESLGSICPVCKEVFGKLEGNQPDGNMYVTMSRLSLPGYPHCGTIEITYNIPSGIQTSKHPNPGKPFHGAKCHAYLPDNNEGNEVLGLLHRAFHQKLIFTVGKSTTSDLDNLVTWNHIHHKTNTHGGPESYGYPDADYLKRVKDELKAKGIK
ncbi:uncharacterized protein dtx3lb.3 isoform X1 [Onychostoma macrolepis]|nr:uncharacterized protein dtx3lb.3 isoform X1 [Onychostoma macrolepis]